MNPSRRLLIEPLPLRSPPICTSLSLRRRILLLPPHQILPLLPTPTLHSPKPNLQHLPPRIPRDTIQKPHPTIQPLIPREPILHPLLDVLFGRFLFLCYGVGGCGVLGGGFRFELDVGAGNFTDSGGHGNADDGAIDYGGVG